MLFSLNCCMRNRKHASIMHILIVNHYWRCIPLMAHRALNHNPWCTCTPQETVREQAEKKQSRLKTLRRQLRKHTSATSWGNTSGVIANTQSVDVADVLVESKYGSLGANVWRVRWPSRGECVTCQMTVPGWMCDVSEDSLGVNVWRVRRQSRGECLTCQRTVPGWMCDVLIIHIPPKLPNSLPHL